MDFSSWFTNTGRKLNSQFITLNVPTQWLSQCICTLDAIYFLLVLNLFLIVVFSYQFDVLIQAGEYQHPNHGHKTTI